jgi:hypothetical protein
MVDVSQLELGADWVVLSVDVRSHRGAAQAATVNGPPR